MCRYATQATQEDVLVKSPKCLFLESRSQSRSLTLVSFEKVLLLENSCAV